jgi:NitT/TauT family transport system substrate-binding protein
MRRILLSSVALVAIGTAVGCSSSGGSSTTAAGAPGSSPAAASGSSTPVTTVTEYSGQSTTSAPQSYAAQAEGIYAKYGLKVKEVTISGATSAEVQALAADKTGFAFTGGDIADEMLVADKSKDASPLVAVSADEMLNPVALFFLKSSGITKPSDLIGKTIGVPSGSTSEEYLDVFLAKEGIPKDKVTIQNVSFAAQAAALMSKKVDANAEFVRGGGSLAILGKEHGEQIGSFTFGSYGIAAPLSATLVQRRLVTEHPAVAKDIALADAAANKFCVTNPAQCMKDYVAANPGVDYDNALAEWKTNISKGSTWNAATAAKETPAQFGYFSADLIAKTVPELEQLFGMKTKFNPATLYTNRFMAAPGT